METCTEQATHLATYPGGCRGAEPTLSMRGVGRSPAGTAVTPGYPVEGGHLDPRHTSLPLSMPSLRVTTGRPVPTLLAWAHAYCPENYTRVS